jgi:hypothetical protein
MEEYDKSFLQALFSTVFFVMFWLHLSMFAQPIDRFFDS